MSRISSVPGYQFPSRTRRVHVAATRIVVKQNSLQRTPWNPFVKEKQSSIHGGSQTKGDEHMKTVTRIVYPGVTAASLRMRSPEGLGEHSRIRWGLFLLV